jgi:hypothetical protein
LQRGRHQFGRLVAGVAEHDALVAGALVLVSGGVDADRDVGRLRMQVAVEHRVLPVEAVLLVADVSDRGADERLQVADDGAREGLVVGLGPARRPARTSPARMMRLVGDQGFTGDPRLWILRQERRRPRYR